ncbi:MAG TPA: hypothetical protein VGO57_11240 [Verrucomicrobiae bacterium]|jgi:hypothetical protein
MNLRAKKIIFLLLAGALLFSAGRVQQSLNVDRDRLGMTQMAVLDNAPPMLAFTTVALGGFRGLISNFLWIRANDLQQDDKFFEAAQLANWITDLEPHFTQVWIFQGWNMSYNISVKFKDAPDRWRWVENGIELLRDGGLHYNPDDVLIYRELAWQFQHKMGANLDDANQYYKVQWAREMAPFFGPNGTNFTALIAPQTPAEKTNAQVLLEKYKIDPKFAKQVDDEWGPFDWRLPEAHAIYWGAKGLAVAKANPGRVKEDDLITLRRIIYQSIYQAFKHGRIVVDPFDKSYSLGPNLDLIPKVNLAYEKMFAEETQPSMRDGILRAQRNFLRDAIYFLYVAARKDEAAKWFKYLGDKFPDKAIVENDPTSLPKNLTLDQYAFDVVQIDIGETSQERVTSAIAGFITQAFLAQAVGDDDRAENFRRLAKRVYEHYTAKTTDSKGTQRVALPLYNDMRRAILNNLLDPQGGLPYAGRAMLRTQLAMPAETNAPALSTNAVLPDLPSTNAVAPVRTNSAAK